MSDWEDNKIPVSPVSNEEQDKKNNENSSLKSMLQEMRNELKIIKRRQKNNESTENL